MINLNKDGARPFRLRICFGSRHVGVVATCIFANILQLKAPRIPTSDEKSGFLDVFHE